MLIDAIADHGVFQLAIGGGEPFCRRDIFELVQYASLKGLAVHITTRRYDFNDQEMKELSGIKEQYKKLDIRIDCALSFTYRHLPVAQTEYHGVKGCVAADRIIAISPDGGVYPCSQLIHPCLCSGNILENNLKELWDCSKILRKYRSFREKKVFKESWCGVCSMKNNCSGCRVFADDAMGGDPGCPAPVLPSLREVGKNGRAVDLKEYITMKELKR
jgi:radical SAM protein with 4Fe4S-binding SPASM domain